METSREGVSGSRRTHTKSDNIYLVVLILAFLLTCADSFADEYHYKNILVGERPAGLGGAYTALSDDPAGLFYNPAGIVHATGANISASANAYYGTSKHYDGVIGNHGWDRESSALLPNFFGVIKPIAIGKVGFSYAITDSIIEDQDQVFLNPQNQITRLVINYNHEDMTTQFGPSYAVGLFSGLSAGATLYVHNRKSQEILNQFINFENAQNEWLNTYIEKEEWGVRPVLGFMWSPEDLKYSIGLTLSHNYLLTSKEKAQALCKAVSFANYQTPCSEAGSGYQSHGEDLYSLDVQSDKKRSYPYTINLGAAFFPSHSWLVAGDVSYYSETEDFLGKRRPVWNASLGTEYYLSEAIALRTGFFTSLANWARSSEVSLVQR